MLDSTDFASDPSYAVPLTTYQQYIALSRYSRYLPAEQRRETWEETVDRVVNFWATRVPSLTKEELTRIRTGLLELNVMGSMRVTMTAGAALDRDEAAAYNCSFVNIAGSGPEISLWDSKLEEAGYDEPIIVSLRHPIVFDELLYVLLCGTGAGFSVERQFVSEMPTVGNKLSRAIYKPTQKNFPGVAKQDLSTFDRKSNTVIVADTKYGWASALRIWLVELYNGNFGVKYDTSRVRPEGTPLKTFGGRASGPAPLEKLFDYARDMFQNAQGRKLTSVECHDLCCFIGSVVVVGGVRRTALISLSNLSDDRMRHAKSGDWWNTEPQRAFSNNSVAYTEKPEIGSFMREWQALYDSKSGERGVFNRAAAQRAAAAIGRDPNHAFGVNPCGEIYLRSQEFCNLSEVVVRPSDTLDTLMEKVELATILGTLQSTLTNFVYLSPSWKQNCEEERLLGVSMTGTTDHPILAAATEETYTEAEIWLCQLRVHARETNKKWAKRLKINSSAAITCVKPSGTVSQLVDSASGLHPRYAPYYIRRVRADVKDPLAKVMQEQGFPCEMAQGSDSTLVFSFPTKSPASSVFRDDRSAIEQLKYWLLWKTAWCDHNPSVTIYVREHEWLQVGAWVYEHFDEIGGVSFLPHTDHIYTQAPYEEIDEQLYEELLAQIPKNIDLAALRTLETSDHTTGSQEQACVAGTCVF